MRLFSPSTLCFPTNFLLLAIFATSASGCDPGQANVSSGCITCQPGTYGIGGLGNGCQLCPSGTGTKTGATSADDCGTCPKGTHSTYNQGCMPCPTGGGSLPGAGVCYPCPVGTFNDQSGNGLATTVDGCQFCPAGTGVGSGQLSCKSCPGGLFSLGDGKGCVHNCDLGTGATVGAASQATCGICPGGTYSLGDGLGCRSCPAGQGSSPGSSSCTDCPANMYSNANGLGCINCPPGRTSPPGSAHVTSCTLCPAGQTSALGGPCTDCPAGSYARNPGSATCFQCAAGRASVAGSTGCCECCAGYYSGSGAASCTRCSTGTSFPGSLGSFDCADFKNTPAVQSCDIVSKTSCPPISQGLASGIPLKKKRSTHCRKSFTACPHLSGQGGWDCIDTKNNPEMCGGCVDVDGEGAGKDCTSIPDVNVVSCKKSKCVIDSCRKGFELSDDGRRCVRAVASGLLGFENTAANLFFPYAPVHHP